MRRAFLLFLLLSVQIFAQTRYEAESMKVVGGPNVNPIPILPTSNSMYFWSWGVIAFKPVENGLCQIKLRIREDHAGDQFAKVTINNRVFDTIDTSFYIHTDTITVVDSVWIGFTNDFPNERNVELDYVQLLKLDHFPDSGKVVVSWDSNTEPDLAGYKVYWGMETRKYSHAVDVGLDTFKVITGLQFFVNYFFAVTAYDTVPNESEFSQETSITLYPDTTYYVLGDYNKDGIVDFSDMIEFDKRWASSSQSLEFDSYFDFNQDGIIDFSDMCIFDQNFGKTNRGAIHLEKN